MRDDKQTAGYIADMILELRNLAKGAGLHTLQGLLEISYYEAYSAANPVLVPPNEAEFIEQLGIDVRRRKRIA